MKKLVFIAIVMASLISSGCSRKPSVDSIWGDFSEKYTESILQNSQKNVHLKLAEAKMIKSGTVDSNRFMLRVNGNGAKPERWEANLVKFSFNQEATSTDSNMTANADVVRYVYWVANSDGAQTMSWRGDHLLSELEENMSNDDFK